MFPIQHNMTEHKSESEGSVEKISDDEDDAPLKRAPQSSGKSEFSSPKLTAAVITNNINSEDNFTGTFETEPTNKSNRKEKVAKQIKLRKKESLSTFTLKDQSSTPMGKEFTDKNSILLRPVKEVSPKTMQKKSGKQFGGGGKGGKRSPLPSYYLQKVFNQTVPSTVSTKTPASKCKTPRQVHHPMGENFGSKMFAPPSLSSSECARCKCLNTGKLILIFLAKQFSALFQGVLKKTTQASGLQQNKVNPKPSEHHLINQN